MPIVFEIIMLLQNKVILSIFREIKASAHIYEARISFHKKMSKKEFWIVCFSPLL